MDSPEGRPTTATFAAHSPPVQDSPFYNYLRNLSPIKSVKAAQYIQRFSESNLPPAPPVFMSPQIDVQRQINFAKRVETAAGSDVHIQCNKELNIGLVPCSEKEVQSRSPSGCLDDYLADSVEDSTDSTGLPSESATNTTLHIPQAGCIRQKGNLTKLNDADDGKNVEAAKDQRDADNLTKFPECIPGKVSDTPKSDMCMDPGSGAQDSEQTVAQDILQHPHGSRRHLKFEDSEDCRGNAADESLGYGQPSADPVSLTSSASHPNFGSLVSPHIIMKTSSIQLPRSYSHATSSQFFPHQTDRPEIHSEFLKCDKSTLAAPRPSGMGLHLNHVGEIVSTNSNSAVVAMETAEHSRKQVNIRICNLEKDSNNSSTSEISVNVENNQLGNRAVVASSSAIVNSKPPKASLHLSVIEQEKNLPVGRMAASESPDGTNQHNRISPKKKRKKGTCTDENESCKRCNCRRSKCLKLYCECFAAGVYCADTCACGNCFNKPEYEDTVLDTRKQIESRNPLAFAPKIVKHSTESPANIAEEGSWTPSSARHKRGCNCKKSKCLKRYCECYQAKVGCSDSCRCEGCKNFYGIKAEVLVRRAERWEIVPCGVPDAVDVKAAADKFKSSLPVEKNYISPGPAALNEGSGLCKASKADEFSPTWLLDLSNLTPLPNPHSGAAADEASPYGVAVYDLPKDKNTPAELGGTSTPSKAFIATSPNRKRVSPPHLKLQELDSRISPGSGSSRKFILQEVPSFPSSTSYSDSKGGSRRKC